MTIGFVVAYAAINIVLLRNSGGMDVMERFMVPVPTVSLVLILSTQLNFGRPSWAGVVVIMLALLAVAFFNFALWSSIT